MSLNLDARQRAMLQEMGVTVWTRAETAAPQAPAATLTVAGKRFSLTNHIKIIGLKM